MLPNKDYSSRARKIAYRFPDLSFIGIQVNFWIIATSLYSFLSYMNTANLSQLEEIRFPFSIHAAILSSLAIGIILGIVLGIIDLLLARTGIQKLSLGFVFLLRIILYPIVVFIVLLFIRFFFLDILKTFFATDYSIFTNNDKIWHNIYWSFLIYVAFMAVVISFINQMNVMFGPGILIPLILGKYRTPKEEERFFMFLDLKSSVTHAEGLGHLEYSSLIRDCFMDLNKTLTQNNAEVYQYVGDEAVITWPANEGIRNLSCLSLFYDFERKLMKKHDYYMNHYGLVPEFKAGLHFGIVTAVEVGQIKREIAYHGDAINTAARIQSLCNQYNRSLLISKSVKSILSSANSKYDFEYLGETFLKGRSQAVELYGITE
ncbi:adenylate/guanylate cyclase domain-containing protein [Gramella sp. MAR_2010_147]|uniref:adenylate/guanylate cyclase domain-containing protein n=1 Tax=Gramella sp. MAR_2010_147 TaxID=1250205 RepID=UPI00087D25AC|nr:adenylate/guanylate cyclase domain-containing protein [Gramella sp. MAR_2010_147]SDR68241.1 adenylate cyclase [Gramella sp. MAR_2010_147]